MAIPKVNLNVDPEGYAGSLLRSFPSVRRSRKLKVPKGSSGLGSYLKQQSKMRNRLAKAQLRALEQEIRQGQESHGLSMKAERARQGRERPIFGNNARLDPRLKERQREYGRAGRMALALSRSPRAYRGNAFGARDAQSIISAIGIPAAQRGMMQYGRLQAGQGGSGVGPIARRTVTPPIGMRGSPNPGFQGYPQPYEAGTLPGPMDAMRRDHPYFTNRPGNFRQGSLPEYQSGTIEDIIRQVEGADVENAQKAVWKYLEEGKGTKGLTKRRLTQLQKYLPMDEFGKITTKGGSLIDRGFSKAGGLKSVFGVDALLDPMFGAIQNQPEGAELMRSMGIDMPKKWYREGTLPGTLPKNQKAKLHKGEAVISADQMDEPLMSYLIGDKLRKMQTGQMDGEGTGPGRGYVDGTLPYAKGTLPSYRRGFATPDIDPRMAAALGLDILGTPPREEEELSPPPDALPDPLEDPQGWAALYGPGRFSRPEPGTEGQLVESAPDYLTPESLGITPPGGAPTSELEEAVRAAEAQKPEAIPGEPSMIPMDPLAEHRAAQSTRDMEVALSRVGSGDLGTAVNPLTLRGDPSAELKEAYNSPGITGVQLEPGVSAEDQTFNPESKAWRQSEHEKFMAITNRSKAERIQDYLANSGGEMDPQQARTMENQAKFYDRQADTIEKRGDRKRELFQKAQQEIKKLWVTAQENLAKMQMDDTAASREAALESMQEVRDWLRDNELTLGDEETDIGTRRNNAKTIAAYAAKSMPEVPDAATYYAYLEEQYGL